MDIGFPGRHHPPARHSREPLCPLRGVLIAQQREGGHFAGVMALGTVGEQDRSNIAIIGHRRFARVCVDPLERATDRLGLRYSDRLAGCQRRHRLEQVAATRLRLFFVDIRIKIVDPAAVSHGASRIDEKCLRHIPRMKQGRQLLRRVEQEGKAKPKLVGKPGGRVRVTDGSTGRRKSPLWSSRLLQRGD